MPTGAPVFDDWTAVGNDAIASFSLTVAKEKDVISLSVVVRDLEV